jgi:hypothetical protein
VGFHHGEPALRGQVLPHERHEKRVGRSRRRREAQSAKPCAKLCRFRAHGCAFGSSGGPRAFKAKGPAGALGLAGGAVVQMMQSWVGNVFAASPRLAPPRSTPCVVCVRCAQAAWRMLPAPGPLQSGGVYGGGRVAWELVRLIVTVGVSPRAHTTQGDTCRRRGASGCRSAVPTRAHAQEGCGGARGAPLGESAGMGRMP